MSSGAIILIGGPASGKTNYLARLWLAFKARKGQLRADNLPKNIHYVDDAVRHLMALRYAPRSERNMEDGRRDFMISVRGDEGRGPERSLTVPDVTGELWRRAVNSYELPQKWIDALKASSSAILFVRAHSKFNAQPMDWVTARELLKMHAAAIEDHLEDDRDEEEEDEDDDDLAPIGPGPGNAPQKAAPSEAGEPVEHVGTLAELEPEAEQPAKPVSAPPKLPAQVGFCELLRYLSITLMDRPDGSQPRVAVVVTAWDMLDGKAKAAGPMQYLRAQFPFLAGKIQTPGRLEIETFGMSIVGGDLRSDKGFKESLKGRDLSEVGYTAVMRDGAMVEDPDVTLPLAWVLGD